MKSELSSIDVRILSEEFKQRLNSARIEKIYQISERELKFKLHLTGRGSLELIIAPHFICITIYGRKTPKEASSFAMQLRKHLSGGFIRDVRQYKFDRIIEFTIERKGIEYLLVVELFSRGNVILLDSDRKIMGLLEWQRWKHRKLGVGQRYEYPPEGVGTPALDSEKFEDVLFNSNRSIASTLAKELTLGGLYAEELCLNSSIDKNRISAELDENERRNLLKSLREFIDKIGKELRPVIILDNGRMIDITPFELETYKNFSQKEFKSFNEAIDEYFSRQEFGEKEYKAEGKFQEKLNRLREIEKGQRKSIGELEEKSENCRSIGDRIYQNLQDVEKVLNLAKNKELSVGEKAGKIVIENINKDGTVVVDIND